MRVCQRARHGNCSSAELGIRQRSGNEPGIDAGGALVSLLAVLLVAWLVAVPLGSSSLPWLNREVRSSALLGGC